MTPGTLPAQVQMRCIIAAILAGLPLAGASLGFQDEPSPPEVAALISKLGAATFAEREAAGRELAALPHVTTASIERVVQGESLSPEQILRLRAIAREHFAREPRAALGIRFAGEDAGGAAINNVIPGFDAARVILPGDVITSIGGDPVSSQEDAIASIVSRDPGDRITIDLIRAQRPTTVDVTLGRFIDLPERPGDRPLVRPEVLDRAWENRLRRKWPADGRQVIEAAVPAGAWARRGPTDAETIMQIPVNPLTGEPVASLLPPRPSPECVAGGEPRIEPHRGELDWRIARQGGAQRVFTARRLAELPAGENDGINPAALARRREALQQRLDSLLRETSIILQRLGDPTLPADARTALKMRHAEVLAQAATIQLQIDEIAARLIPRP